MYVHLSLARVDTRGQRVQQGKAAAWKTQETKRIRNGIQDYAAGVMNSDTTQLSKSLDKNG